VLALDPCAGAPVKRAIIAAVLTITALDAGSVGAKGTSVTGTWRLTVEKIGLRLELAQKKNTVTGTLDWPHGEPIELTGGFTGDTLTFAGDSTGENFSIHVDSTGRLKTDGTMAGMFNAHFVDFNDAHDVVRKFDQQSPWTAPRGEHARPIVDQEGVDTSVVTSLCEAWAV
jgi:hypothetical protein